MKSIFNPRTGVLAAMILMAGAWRLIFLGNNLPMANFTPIGAMALFGGCYFSDKWKAILLPLVTLWLTDVILNSFVYSHQLTFFYSGFYWNYGIFALIAVMGTFIRKVSVKNVLVGSISAALLFWLISDFGVWLGGTMYPKNVAGIIECYAAAIPFLRNMLISNLVFSAIMFGSFELIKFKFPKLATIKA